MPAFQPVGIADRAAGYPRIVHQDVKAVVARQGLCDQLDPCRFAGDVDRRRDGLSAACANMGRDGLCLIPEDVGNHDLGPFRREEPRFGLAHPVRAAGNDRDFVFEPHDLLLASLTVALYWVQTEASARRNVSMIVGSGRFRYRVNADWAKLPENHVVLG
jgi:hypothetical protein